VTDRRTQLAQRLGEVEHRIAVGCDAAGRQPDSVTLIAVTKTFPATDVRLLGELGVADVGENRDQEARPKQEACADLPLRWHLVGQLQRNKARSVAQYADVVHSVDREPLVAALSKGVVAAGRGLTALVQVDLAPQAGSGRGGAAPEQVEELAAAIAAAPGLLLGGVMAVAPQGEDPDAAFARLESVAADLQRAHPEATMISAGMSGDLEAALRHGATHLRVGTALLGDRPPFVG
jgi:PLP dependent protein